MKPVIFLGHMPCCLLPRHLHAEPDRLVHNRFAGDIYWD